MNKTRKGFTLVEMVVVLAIFSIIMFSIVQLLTPVSKFFVRSTNFENTTACVDNMKRCIEGNLKYANRVRAYAGYAPYTYAGGVSTYEPTLGTDTQLEGRGLRGNLESFYNEFFYERKFIDSSGIIYALCFDNTELKSDAELATMSRLADFSEASDPYNSGKIVLYRLRFDNYDAHLDSFDEVFANRETIVWNVNQKLYGNFEYKFALGNFDSTVSGVSVAATTDTSGNIVSAGYNFNPQDFAITISMQEVLRRAGAGLYRGDRADSYVASFAMKNVLDATVKFAKPSYDHVTKCKTGQLETDIDHEYVVPATYTVNGVDYSGNPARYKPIDVNPVALTDAQKKQFDGFYFIYTLPETTYSNDANYATQKN